MSNQNRLTRALHEVHTLSWRCRHEECIPYKGVGPSLSHLSYELFLGGASLSSLPVLLIGHLNCGATNLGLFAPETYLSSNP